MVESVEKEFGVAEAQLDGESLMPETQEILNGLLKVHFLFHAKALRSKGRKGYLNPTLPLGVFLREN